MEVQKIKASLYCFLCGKRFKKGQIVEILENDVALHSDPCANEMRKDARIIRQKKS